MNELPELTQVPAWLAEQIKFARAWWHDDPVCLLPGEEGGPTLSSSSNSTMAASTSATRGKAWSLGLHL